MAEGGRREDTRRRGQAAKNKTAGERAFPGGLFSELTPGVLIKDVTAGSVRRDQQEEDQQKGACCES